MTFKINIDKKIIITELGDMHFARKEHSVLNIG